MGERRINPKFNVHEKYKEVNIINSYRFGGGGGCDPDAVDFNAAVGTLDSTEEDAICALVTTLKADGIWDKCFAIWSFAGTTEDEQKWQLKDPRDLDAAYRLFFPAAAFTNSITGAQALLTISSINTFLNAATVLDVSNTGMTLAIRSNTTNDGNNFGSSSGSHTIITRSNLVGGRIGSSAFVNGGAPASGVVQGVVTVTKTGTTINVYKDGGLEATATVALGSMVSSNVAFGQGNTKNEFCFGVIHEHLTATEVANLHTAIDTYSDTYTGRKNW